MADFDLDAVRAGFPALGRPGPNGVPLVHADAPGGTQVHASVLEAMRGYLTDCNANSHGSFAASRATDELCARVRAKAGALLGTEPGGVVFGPNMTTLTFHLSRALATRVGEGDELVCTQLDHDANVSPWLRLAARQGAEVRFVPLREDGRLEVGALSTLVNERTRVVAFPRASNAIGTLVDPAPFVAAARAVGALTFLDAVHAAPHVPLDRRATGVDVLACSPYKFFGPHAGLLAADPELLAALEPDKVRPAPDEGPERWQTGTASFEAIAGTGAAIDHVRRVATAAVLAHERSLSDRFLSGLDRLDHVTLHGPGTSRDRTPTFAVTVAGHEPDAVARSLADDGILVWSGHYYAVEPMRRLRLLERGGAVRIGFVHYHGNADVDRVLDALERLA